MPAELQPTEVTSFENNEIFCELLFFWVSQCLKTWETVGIIGIFENLKRKILYQQVS